MSNARWGAVLLAGLIVCSGAAAQVPTHLSGCPELREGARKAQTDACLLHQPCNTVLPARKTCEEAKVFIDRLLGGVEGRIAGFLGRKPKELTAEAVFEANAPQTRLDAEWEDKLKAMREQMKAAGKQVITGKDADGEAWVYEGDVQDGKKHGLGSQFWAGGAAYRGRLENNISSGFGELVASNGNRIIGEFRGNRLNGYALRLDADGTSSKGDFVNSRLSKGTIAYASGASYEGEFKDGARHGVGTYRWADGSTHAGSWLNGKQHGPGTVTDASGKQTVGNFQDGKLVVAPAAAVAPAPAPAQAPAPAPAADPIAVARAGCSSDEDSCLKVCAGVGAIGIFSTLRGGKADEASRQLEQCQARCTSEKSTCDAKVAAMQAGPGTNRSETAEVLGKVAGAVIAGRNSTERRENVIGALGGTGAAAGGQAGSSLGDARCPVEDRQPFQDLGTYGGTCGAGDCFSYKPLDCVSVEWRQKAKVTDRRQSGLEARIVNRCACKIEYSHVGTLRGIDDGKAYLAASHTTTWHSALTEDKKFEVVPATSCHYTDELMGTYYRDIKRCVARKCKGTERYGSCGYATTK